jgi:arylsulfatase A-like enzyme
VIFTGSDISAAQIARPVTPYDIAPTLSAFLGITPPSGSAGNPLEEVINQ